MNNLEKDMIKAIQQNKYWTKGNTRVNPCVGFIEVQVNDQTIATVDNSYGWLNIPEDIHNGITTHCVESRLNALKTMCR